MGCAGGRTAAGTRGRYAPHPGRGSYPPRRRRSARTGPRTPRHSGGDSCRPRSPACVPSRPMSPPLSGACGPPSMIPAEGRPLRATTGIVPGRPLVLWAGHPEPVSRQVIAIACVAVLALIGMDRWMGLSGARMINERDKNQGTFDVTRTDEEWQAALSPKQYAVLRRHDTEYPGTSPLLNEHRPGSFVCAGCGQPLFDSDTKFESGSGWAGVFGGPG